MIDCPCRNCSDRQIGCHGKCDKYKTYKDEIQVIAEERKSKGKSDAEYVRRWNISRALKRKRK